MTITTSNDLVYALANRQQICYIRKAVAAREGSSFQHLTAMDPGFPGAWGPGTPGLAGRVCERSAVADRGCLAYTAATGGRKLYLNMQSVHGTVSLRHQLVDVLWVNSGIVVTTTTTQSWTATPLPPRDADGYTAGRGCRIGLFISVATTNGSANSTMTMGYTSSDGYSGRVASVGATGTAAVFPATGVAGTFVEFNLQSGDEGVQSIDDITLAVSLGAGTVHAMVIRNIGVVAQIGAADPKVFTGLETGMPEILPEACVFMMDNPAAATSAGQFSGLYQLLEG